MPGRTISVIFVSGVAGFVMFVFCAMFGGAVLGSLFDQSGTSKDISDISARKVTPRR